MKRVPELLLGLAQVYEQRNELYGDNYKLPIMSLLFPDGVTLRSEEDFTRYGVFVQVVSKVSRYAVQFGRGGHADSLNDLSVYAAMLQELDEMASGEPGLPFDAAAEVDRIRGKTTTHYTKKEKRDGKDIG
jgi:hypothetical protein|tara:strand:+ start:27 stop:419 length:393 start_codon:yes stop_codon:yes gene_type:complete